MKVTDGGELLSVKRKRNFSASQSISHEDDDKYINGSNDPSVRHGCTFDGKHLRRSGRGKEGGNGPEICDCPDQVEERRSY